MANLIWSSLLHCVLCFFTTFGNAHSTSVTTANDTLKAEAACNTGYFRLWGGDWKDSLHGWWDVGDELDFPFGSEGPAPFPTTPATATVVTYVDAAAGTTSLDTVMPTDWVPPPTNADGTQIRVITYESASRQHTTTLAFPTPFAIWPSEYGYSFCLAGESCESAGFCSDETRTIPEPTPQFTQGAEFDFLNGSYGDPSTLRDPKGLFANYARAHGPGAFPLPLMHRLFPDHPALDCRCEDQGPAWGGFITRWEVVTTTIFMSKELTSGKATPTPSG
jgi:hypothetical protein